MGARIASITDFLTADDINMVFDHLEKKYGYSTQWKIDCWQYITEQSKFDSKMDPFHPVLSFLRFGVEKIEPFLNAALCNPYHYAFFSRMVFWLVRDRLEGAGCFKFYDGETF